MSDSGFFDPADRWEGAEWPAGSRAGAAAGPATPQALPLPLPDEVYDPDRHLQGLVAHAWREGARLGRAVHITGPWPAVTVYPNSLSAVVEGGVDSLRDHAGRPDLPRHAQLTLMPAPQYAPNHPDMVALDVLLWKLALGASRGRLPRGTSLDSPCALHDWPNVTRLGATPGALSICALWMHEAHTLAATVHRLALEPADVYAFYSAAQALGLIHPWPRPTEPARPEAAVVVDTGAQRGLLRRLFDKLRSG